MSWYNKIVEFFVKDSAERRRFVNEFNKIASHNFQNLTINALFEAHVCSGKLAYRHELSAPVIASGLEIQIKAGMQVPLEVVIALGRVILCDEALVRRMFILHWDTLIIRDSRNGYCVDWRIRDFVNFGGVLNQSNSR
jgi:hypothetical protein